MASATALTVASSTLAALAVTSHGFAATDVHRANDSVWVTSARDALVGRLNQQIGHLDSGVSLNQTQDFDVLQGDGHVFVYDRAADKLRSLDPATVTMDDGVSVPAKSTVAYGGGTLAILNPADGNLWVMTVGSLPGFDPAVAKATANLEPGASIAVGLDGVVHGVDVASDQLWTLTPGSAGAPASKSNMPLGVDTSAAQVTAVGAQAVVLDQTHGQLIFPGGKTVAVPGGTAASTRLQQPSPTNDRVAVATATSLALYPLDGSASRAVFSGGSSPSVAPAAPVWLDGCLHGAWSGPPATYVRACDGKSLVQQTFQLAAGGGQLAFRVDDGVIALNDLATGGVWLPERNLQVVQDWAQLTTSVSDKDKSGPKQTNGTTANVLSKKNRPPVANADRLGARPGVPTDLPVLTNDTDPDGDVLVIDKVLGAPAGTELVDNGQQIQFTFPVGATTAAQFEYQISDGNGGTASTSVTVTPRTSGNLPPTPPASAEQQTVELGKALRFDALNGWTDPDGDPLYLAGAAAADTGNGDQVSSSPDGTVDFVETTAPGPHTVNITVSDGTATKTTAVTVNVLKPGTEQPPLPHNDFAVAAVGQTVTIRPLTNDTDPNDDSLRLSQVSTPAGATVDADLVAGTVRFTAAAAGAYTMTYTVVDVPSAGVPQSAPGRIRVEVVSPTGNQPPTAVADVAAVRAGQPTSVNVLDNDTDPDGDVLVVQSVDVPGGSPVAASVVGHQTVYLTAQQDLTAPVRLSYTVSDGLHAVTAPITVVPAAAITQPPVAVPDQAVVRAGSVGTIDVLANDIDPLGGQLTLQSVSAIGADPSAAGDAYISGSLVKFLAPTQQGPVTLTYTISDTSGAQATGTVAVQVTAVNPATDKAPSPEPVQARVLAGGTVKISVPLDGTDPDGDPVVLVGETSAPQKGAIISRGPDSLTYQAFPGAQGTDSFTYALRDPYGKEGESTIQVGVAPAPPTNSPPLAVDDSLTVPPGITIDARVLDNDSDPDGDAITFDPTKQLLTTGGVKATVVGDHLSVQVPAIPGTSSVEYFITDGNGGTASALLTITADAGAKHPAPQPKDDYVTYLKPDNEPSVLVPVLKNDIDPDAPASTMTVSLVKGEELIASVVGQQVRVVTGAQPRTVVYEVTDKYGETGQATIFVPAQGNQPPQPVANPPRQQTQEGQPLTLKVADFAFDPEGAALRLTQTSNVTGTNGDARPTDFQTVVYTPNPGYSGPASVTFEVTDGATVQDPKGLKATFSVPITVIAKEDHPPTFRASPVILNEGVPQTVDLRRDSNDQDPGDLAGLTYSGLSGVTGELQATLKGSQLSLSVRSPATAASFILHFTVTDPHGKSTIGELDVHVVPKPAPLPGAPTTKPAAAAPTPTKAATSPPPAVRTAPIAMGPFKSGHVVSVDPFSRGVVVPPGVQPHVTGASVITPATGKASVGGNTVTYSPAPTFVGTAQVEYTVVDNFNRTVNGTIRITYEGPPDPPTAPTATVVSDTKVLLTWSAPQDNGAAIDKYGVVQADGTTPVDCQFASPTTTSCTVQGLTAGVQYVFRVKAHNAEQWGQAGAASQPVTPDLAPLAPAAPTVTYQPTDVQQLTVNWAAPATSQGSAVTTYTVVISPAAPDGTSTRTVAAPATTWTWTGLTNGQQYTFSVIATNAKGSSPPSPPSAPEHPNDKPAAPVAPTAENTGGALGQQITVTWVAPANNGDAINSYTINVYDNGTLGQTLTAQGDQTSKVVAVTNGHSYSFTVAAYNRAGSSDASPKSDNLTSFGKPAQIPSVSATAGNGSATLTFATPDSNGKPITQYEAQYTGHAASVTVSASPTTISGLTNGNQYAFQVRACNDTYCGDWSPASARVRPHGDPQVPVVSVSNPNQESVRFSWGPGDGQGCTITSMQYEVDGGAWTSTGAGSIDVGNQYNQNHSAQLRMMTDCSPSWLMSNNASGNTGDKPLTADATESFGTCPPPGQTQPAFCGGDSHSYTTTAYSASAKALVPQGTLVHADCWTTGSPITAKNSSSSNWVHIVDAPGGGGYPWMSVLYFPGPVSVPDGLPHC